MEQDVSRGGWGEGVPQAEGNFQELGGEGEGKGLEAQVVAALEAEAGEVPGWVRLLPLGEVPLGDDREPLWVDGEALAAMVAHFEARGLDLVVDYEHQTLSGQKAPAAGWIRELEIRIAGETPATQDGLWARVEWTAMARGHIEAREYRYFSPVLRLEEGSRRPLALLHAALTNTPAINGLTPLVAKSSSQQLKSSSQQSAVSSQWGESSSHYGGGLGEAERQIPPNPPLEKGEEGGRGGGNSGQESAVSSQLLESIGHHPAGMGGGGKEVHFPPHPNPLPQGGRGDEMIQGDGPGYDSQGVENSSQQLAVSSQWEKNSGQQVVDNRQLMEGSGREEAFSSQRSENGGEPAAVKSQKGGDTVEELVLAKEGRQGADLLVEVAALLGLPGDAGPAGIRGAVLALKGNLEHFQGVREELAALKGELNAKVVQEEVEAAMKSGKIQPCQKDSALRYARQDLEGFRAFVENSLPQVPMGRLNLGPDTGEDRRPGRGLTPQQLLICQSMGLTPEAFKAQEEYLRGEEMI